MGAWTFIRPRLRKIFGREFAFIGRAEAASPATGMLSEHKREQARIVREAVETKKLSGTEILV
jgi:2-oxoglutarate dehydrogenase E1 component